MMTFLLSLLAPFWGYIVAAVAALGAVLGVYIKARSDGAKSVETKVLKNDLETTKKLNDVLSNGPRDRDAVVDRLQRNDF